MDGVLILLNTLGGDVEAGLAIAEMIASLSKPTVSLVLGGSHSIGGPLAVSADYSFIVPSGTMIVHPVRSSGMFIGVIQSYRNMEKTQDRITRFIAAHSQITKERLEELMLDSTQLVKDVGTMLEGEDAVREGMIDEVGGISMALKKAAGNDPAEKMLMTHFSIDVILDVVCVIIKGEVLWHAKSTRKKKTTRKKSSKNQASTSLNSEILILVMFAVCVLMLLSNFGVIGIAGSAISSVLFGFFGVMAYILPFLLFGVVAFGISNKGNTHAYIKIAACVALLFAICAFFQLVMHPFDAKESFVELLSVCQ